MTNSRILPPGAIEVITDTGRLVPDPPPSADICEASNRKTSATTQVPIAK
ncbi:MAG: hypothetical protein R3D52_03325 [Xanthobacteraceae bacterium]